MDQEPLIVATADGVRTLTLNRPERRNALNADLLARLDKAVAALAADPDVRVVLLTGRGKAFCAGADLRSDGSSADGPSVASMRAVNELFNRIEALPQVVIGAANGDACAGGLELLLCCDLILAADTARLADVHARVGLIPGAGGAYRLTRRIGAAAAGQLLYTGDFFDARHCQRIGLVNEVVAAEDLAVAAADLARRLAQHSPLALRAIKRMVAAAPAQDVAAGMEFGLALNDEYMASADYAEAMAAFRERRAPAFRGA